MEAILASIAKGFATNFFSPLSIKFLTEWGLDSSSVDELTILLNSVESVWNSADGRRHEEDPNINMWLEKAASAIYDTEDLLERILLDVPLPNQVHGRVVDSMKNNDSVMEKIKYKFKEVGRTFNPSKKTRETEVSKLINRLQVLIDQKDSVFWRVPLTLSENVDEMIEYRKIRITKSKLDVIEALNLYGEIKSSILKLLKFEGGKDDEFRVISIVGIAGVGKTTLARNVYNEAKDSFDVKCWVCVTEDFNFGLVNQSLLQGISENESQIITDLSVIQAKLKEKLQKKRFLFVLDDIWNNDHDKWGDLLKP